LNSRVALSCLIEEDTDGKQVEIHFVYDRLVKSPSFGAVRFAILKGLPNAAWIGDLSTSLFSEAEVLIERK